jgi:hypothetical protein
VDLSEDEIMFPADNRHTIRSGMDKSRDGNAPTPYIFSPTTIADLDQHLEAILWYLMLKSFTYMNGQIKGHAE